MVVKEFNHWRIGLANCYNSCFILKVNYLGCALSIELAYRFPVVQESCEVSGLIAKRTTSDKLLFCATKATGFPTTFRHGNPQVGLKPLAVRIQML